MLTRNPGLYTATVAPRPDRRQMNSASLDVVGIGNAIVDVIAHADDAFLAGEGLAKGTMTLVDAPRAEALYQLMGPASQTVCRSR